MYKSGVFDSQKYFVSKHKHSMQTVHIVAIISKSKELRLKEVSFWRNYSLLGGKKNNFQTYRTDRWAAEVSKAFSQQIQTQSTLGQLKKAEDLTSGKTSLDKPLKSQERTRGNSGLQKIKV